MQHSEKLFRSPNEQRDLRGKNERQPEAKLRVARLVAEEIHSRDRAHAAADDGKQKKRLFRYAACPLALGAELVPALDEEGDNIERRKCKQQRAAAEGRDLLKRIARVIRQRIHRFSFLRAQSAPNKINPTVLMAKLAAIWANHAG